MDLAVKDGCSITDVLNRYTWAEIKLWEARGRVFGPLDLGERLDILFARQDALFAEANRDRKKRREPYTPEDMRTKWGVAKKKEPVVHTEQSLYSKAKRIFAAFGLKDG